MLTICSKKICVWIFIIVVFFVPNAYSETPMSAFSVPEINTPLLYYSDLPEDIASCFDDVEKTYMYIFPNEWNENRSIFDNSGVLPVICIENNQSILYILEKTIQGEWKVKLQNSSALQPTYKNMYNTSVKCIDSFYFDPDIETSNGTILPGIIKYTYFLIASEQEYVVSITYKTSPISISGWGFDNLQVIMPITTKSIYLNGIKYDDWKIVATEKSLQYVYTLHEQTVGFFNVDLPANSTQLDAASFDINTMIEPTSFFIPTQIDSSTHGNGKAVNLRATPNGKIIAKIANRSDILASNLSDDWILVKHNDSFGYIDALYIKDSAIYLGK